MKKSIVIWIKDICKKYKLSAYYFPPNDAYIIHYKGNVVCAFYGNQFYDLSPTVRAKSIKGNFAGLENNISERYGEQVKTPYRSGRTIVK